MTFLSHTMPSLFLSLLVLSSIVSNTMIEGRTQPSSIMLVNLANHMVDPSPLNEDVHQQILYYMYTTVAFGLFVLVGIIVVVTYYYVVARARKMLKNAEKSFELLQEDIQDSDDADEKVVLGVHNVMISGHHPIDGLYERTDELIHGATVYRKQNKSNNDVDLILCYYAPKKEWQVKPASYTNEEISAHVGPLRVHAYCPVITKCLPQLAPAGNWHVFELTPETHTRGWRAQPRPDIVVMTVLGEPTRSSVTSHNNNQQNPLPLGLQPQPQPQQPIVTVKPLVTSVDTKPPPLLTKVPRHTLLTPNKPLQSPPYPSNPVGIHHQILTSPCPCPRTLRRPNPLLPLRNPP